MEMSGSNDKYFCLLFTFHSSSTSLTLSMIEEWEGE